MTRDYKPRAEHANKPSSGSPFLAGLLLGVLLGVAASFAVVMYIQNGENTFADLTNTKKPLSEQIAESGETISVEQKAPPGSDEAEDKTRFDFYTILPGSESKVNPEEVTIQEAQQQPATQATYYLQVGAFQTEADADNMKAKLALQGYEAAVQTATIPGKGIWHRVRVGPLKNLDEINKTKNDLADNGFQTDLIKINNETQ